MADTSVTDNVVTLPDGTQHIFPGDTTPEQMQKALGSWQQTQGQNTRTMGDLPFYARPLGLTPGAIDSLRPILAGIAGTGAATAASMIPVAGPALALPAETAAYSGIDYLLKKLNPQPSATKQSTGSEAADSIRDGLINAVGGRVLSGVFKGFNALRNAELPEIYKFAPTTSQALEASGNHALATSAKFAEDFGATGAKAAALDKSAGAGFTQALKVANAFNGRLASTNSDPVKLADKIRSTLEDALEPEVKPQNFKSWSKSFIESPTNKPPLTPTQEAVDILQGGQNPFSKLDAVIQDPDRLSKVLTAGQLMGPSGINVRQDLQAYQFMRMVNDAKIEDAAKGTFRLDASKMNNVWKDPDLQTSLNTLYGKEGRKTIDEFIKNVAATQDKITSYPIAKQLRFLGSGFSLAGNLLTGNLHGAGLTGLGMAAAYLPTAVLGRLLLNKSTSEIVGKLAAGAPLSVPANYAGKAILSALQGTNIALMDAQGNKTWGTIDKSKDGSDYEFFPTK